jgi:hypothetical protein
LSDAQKQAFRRERRAGMLAIAISAPVAIVLWIALFRLTPPLAGLDDLGARMAFTLKCGAVAVLFCLFGGVEAVAHERLVTRAFDPLTGFETRRLRVNKQYLQNTLEQTVLFLPGLFGLAAYSPTPTAMRSVVATTVVWIVARFAFWIGYHRSAAMRGLGAPGMAMSLLVLLYVTGRFGYELGGEAMAAVLLAAFLALEAVLFWTTSRSAPPA